MIRSECSAAGVPVGGNGSVSPCVGLWVVIALVAVGLLPPAFSLWPQAPPGKKAWWNAKAGAAITVNMRAEANATASNVFSLTNRGLLTSDGCYGPSYASFPPADVRRRLAPLLGKVSRIKASQKENDGLRHYASVLHGTRVARMLGRSSRCFCPNIRVAVERVAVRLQ